MCAYNGGDNVNYGFIENHTALLSQRLVILCFVFVKTINPKWSDTASPIPCPWKSSTARDVNLFTWSPYIHVNI